MGDLMPNRDIIQKAQIKIQDLFFAIANRSRVGPYFFDIIGISKELYLPGFAYDGDGQNFFTLPAHVERLHEFC
jgi:hypothetical protein